MSWYWATVLGQLLNSNCVNTSECNLRVIQFCTFVNMYTHTHVQNQNKEKLAYVNTLIVCRYVVAAFYTNGKP